MGWISSLNEKCIEWGGGRNSSGYGTFRSGKKMVLAHRWAYSLFNGHIPNGLFVCHTCDTPSCINPHHLFVGTSRDNMRDMVNKGRNRPWLRYATHCKYGHPFSPENTRHSTQGEKKTPVRYCMECRRRRDAEFRQRRRNNVNP